MDENTKPSSDNSVLPDFPATLDPEEVLGFLVGALRSPVNSLEAWAQILSMEDANEEYQQATKTIPIATSYITNLLKRAIVYLQERRIQDEADNSEP
jgi:hypothetical protein